MVKISYDLAGHHAEKEVESAEFLLTNKRGGYLSLSAGQNPSRFSGCHFFRELRPKPGSEPAADWQLFKTVDKIQLYNKDDASLSNAIPAEAILVRPGSAERKTGNISETFFMPHSDSFQYNVKEFTGKLAVYLDCRKIYDFNDQGRIYSISRQDGLIIVEYAKFQDSTLNEKAYSIYLAIKGNFNEKDVGLLQTWEKDYYPYDAERNSSPKELYVFRAFSIACEKALSLSFGFSDIQEEAVENADKLQRHAHEWQDEIESHQKRLGAQKFALPDPAFAVAYACASASIDSLYVSIPHEDGIFAGLPWFFQFWSRDEAISLGALIAQEQYKLVAKILKRLLRQLREDGRLTNRFPKSELASADSVGWAFKRLGDLIEALEKRKLLDDILPEKDLLYFKDKLDFSLKSIMEKYLDRGLIYNNPLETWMDTDYGGDTRQGKRIEIQCLFLKMLEVAKKLSKLLKDTENYDFCLKSEKIYSQSTRELFYDGEKLCDGLGDATQRPNVFLAHYIYPQLLSGMQWRKVFSYALDRIWLGWGGLATIDKGSPLFTQDYTGENNQSYHRGDSWYFINNLAAISMHQVSRRGFSKEIQGILNSSTSDILYQGFLGHHSEVSSASRLKPQGCKAQAWSAASYVELMHEIGMPL